MSFNMYGLLTDNLKPETFNSVPEPDKHGSRTELIRFSRRL